MKGNFDAAWEAFAIMQRNAHIGVHTYCPCNTCGEPSRGGDCFECARRALAQILGDDTAARAADAVQAMAKVRHEIDEKARALKPRMNADGRCVEMRAREDVE